MSAPDITKVPVEDLNGRLRVLRDEYAALRRLPAQRTRKSALGRVDETLAKLDNEIDDLRQACRFRLATEYGPLDSPRLERLAALLVAREKLGPLLIADIERETLRGEADPWRDDAADRKATLAEEIAALEAEIDLRLAEDRIAALDDERKTVVGRLKKGAKA